MTKPTCQQIFKNALNERLKHPLLEGEFKLKEARHALGAIHDEIQTIAALKRGEVNAHRLQQCQTWEIAGWLRGNPAYVAHVLGHTLLPALGALEADGVPADEAALLRKIASQRINNITAKLDTAQQTLAAPIGHEYDRMRAGVPTLVSEIQDVLDLVESTLNRCRPWVNAPMPASRSTAPAKPGNPSCHYSI